MSDTEDLSREVRNLRDETRNLKDEMRELRNELQKFREDTKVIVASVQGMGGAGALFEMLKGFGNRFLPVRRK